MNPFENSPHVSLVLDADTSVRAVPTLVTGAFGPHGCVTVNSRLRVQSNSVEHLLALADAAQEAARQLRAEQIRAEIRQAVA